MSCAIPVIYGQTATGKTALAMALAIEYPVEVIAADSGTVYRGLDIATAKPSVEERQLVPHHLVDIADPNDMFTVAEFQKLALSAINDVRRRKSVPLVVGGGRLYVSALVNGLDIPAVAPNSQFRDASQDFERQHPGVLYEKLRLLDPAAASWIHPHNIRRTIRFLEVIEFTGSTVSGRRGSTPRLPFQVFALRMDYELLDRVISKRIDKMFASGLVDEVQGLLRAGVSRRAPSMHGIGYRETAALLNGELTFEQALEGCKQRTRRLARRQLSWFKKDPSIRWITVVPDSANSALDQLRHAVQGFMNDDAKN